MSARHTSLEDKQRRMRERHGRGASVPDPEFVSLDFKERHYTATELATLWNMHPSTIRRVFGNMPGVLKIGAMRRLHKQSKPYRTIRIPESIAKAWYEENLQ